MSKEAHKKEHDATHLEKLTIKELREIAAEIPHERAVHDMKKEELVAFIKETRGIKDEPHVKKKHTHHKITLSKEQIKAKIRELKDLKMQALEADDRKKSTTLCHQIGRLKKKTRKEISV